MSLRRKYMDKSIEAIKDYLKNSSNVNKSIFLERDEEIIALHASLDYTDQGEVQLDAWCALYSADLEFLKILYNFDALIDDEAEYLKKQGWKKLFIS